MKRLALLVCAFAFLRPLGHAAEPVVNGHPLSEVARARLETPAAGYWLGEIFPLHLRVEVAPGYLSLVPPAFEWSPGAVVMEDWSAPARADAAGRDVSVQGTRAYARAAGAPALPAATRAVSLITGYNGDRSANTDAFALPVTMPDLRIRPLPAPAPAGFANAVGDFALRSTVSATSIAVGESVTWTLELSGTGNWPEIGRLPGRVISKDFQAVAPVVKRSSKPGVLFEGALAEDVLLVANQPGDYQLGPVRFTYFDPKSGTYKMITTETFSVQVGGQAAAGAARAARDAQAAGTPVPAAPPPLPLDPLETRSRGWRPLPRSWPLVAVASAVFAVAISWFRLARRRSEMTDPLHARRRARAELGAILTQLDRGGLAGEELRRLVFAWQQATTALAALAVATPTADEIAAALEPSGHGTRGSSWAHLWRDASRALYGQQATLPADWIMRARAAWSEVRLPAVPLRAAFRGRNLVPLGAIAAGALLMTNDAGADDGAAAYLRGDFAAAEAAWTKAAAEQPLDARARYNLALAAAQQNRWSESAAQALAAFCLDARDPAIRWQLAMSVDRAGINQAQITTLAHGTSWSRVARVMSPGEWGLAVILAALGSAASVSAVLVSLYQARRGLFRVSATVAAVLALSTLVAGLVSLERYGPLADEATAVVSRNTLLCSVPTEIDRTQKTVPLPAGSMGKVDRSFLGWSRLVFANGQTGWVRTDAVVRLYH